MWRAAGPGRAARPPPTRALGSMARIVMKFGGTSVADLERHRHVARRVQREVAARPRGCGRGLGHGRGHQPAGRLRDRESAKIFDLREYDVVVSSGEQVTAGLLAIVLQPIRGRARAFLARLADADPHGRRPRQRPDRGDRGPRSAAPHRPRARSRWSPAFRGSIPGPGDDPGARHDGRHLGGALAAAARPSAATSIPTSTVSTPPTRGS